MHLILGLRTPAHCPEGIACIRLNLPAEKNHETLLKYRQQLFKQSGDQPRQAAFKKAEFCRGVPSQDASTLYHYFLPWGICRFPTGDKSQSESNHFGQKPAALLVEETHNLWLPRQLERKEKVPERKTTNSTYIFCLKLWSLHQRCASWLLSCMASTKREDSLEFQFCFVLGVFVQNQYQLIIEEFLYVNAWQQKWC